MSRKAFKLKMQARLKVYAWNLLIALDQLVNVISGGYPDETFSCRTHRKAQAGQWFWRLLQWIIDRIFFWQAGHCREAYQSEQLRRHFPAELAD